MSETLDNAHASWEAVPGLDGTPEHFMMAAQAQGLLALADAVEDLVTVVRESVRVPVVFNITGKTLSDYDAQHIKAQLQRLLNPSTVRDVDLSPEAVPHD